MQKKNIGLHGRNLLQSFIQPHKLILLPCFLLVACGTAPSNKNSNTLDWKEYKSSEASEYSKECQSRYQKTHALFQEIGSSKFDQKNLLNQLNRLDLSLDGALGKSSLMSNVHPEEEVRKAAEECQQKFVTLLSDISLSRPIYDQISSVNTSMLSEVDKRFVENRLRDLRRSGVNLNKSNRKRVKQLNQELLQLGQTFYKNTREDVRTLSLSSKDQLDGLPQDYIDRHPADENGIYKITTNYPDYFPFMQYAKDDTARLELYKLFKSRAHPENESVLKALLEKRFELATILGYKNYAEYATEVLMIKTPQNAQDFINKVNAIAEEKAAAEYDELLNELKKLDPNAKKVGDWQKTFLSEIIKKENFQVDSQEVRQYFQYGNVKDGIFELTESLFGVTFKKWDTEVWHPSVEAYELIEGDKVLGRFYLDMHPRTGKYKHAAAFSLNSGVQDLQLPVKALVCNFPGEKSGSELMEHSQVETFLHEFGHLLHGLFGGHTKWVEHSGTNTERDFVEAPSQILEEWVWDSDTLKSFAKNSKGETIPDELIEKMRASRDYGKGIFTKHQMYYASISLNFYNQNPENLNMSEVSAELQSKYSNFDFVEDTYFHTSFGHLVGYSAAYYTYMWSLVISSDMFEQFKTKGLRNKEIAQHYRDTVLAAGGSKDANDIVKEFLGRPYNFDAFTKDLKEGN